MIGLLGGDMLDVTSRRVDEVSDMVEEVSDMVDEASDMVDEVSDMVDEVSDMHDLECMHTKWGPVDYQININVNKYIYLIITLLFPKVHTFMYKNGWMYNATLLLWNDK